MKNANFDTYNNEILPTLNKNSYEFLFAENENIIYKNGSYTLKPIGIVNLIDTKNEYTNSLSFDSTYPLSSQMYSKNTKKIGKGAYLDINSGKNLSWNYNIEDLNINTDFKTNERKIDYINTSLSQKIDDNFYKNIFKLNPYNTIQYKSIPGIENDDLTNGINYIVLNNVKSIINKSIINKNPISMHSNLTNGIYSHGWIYTNISRDEQYNINGFYKDGSIHVEGKALLYKHTSLIDAIGTFNDNNTDYSYIFNQQHDPVFYEQMEVDINEIIGLTTGELFEQYLKPERWEFIVPTIYQTYEFKKSYTLSKISFNLTTPGNFNEKYKGKISVMFGFLINGKINKNSIIHTSIVDVDANDPNSSLFKTGIIDIELDVPITIPKNKTFFIGFIKESTLIENGEECTFKYIENGEYDIETDILVSYPSNFNSNLNINGINFNNKLLKIDFIVNKYDTNNDVEISSTIDLYAGQPELSNFMKFLAVTNEYAPENTSIIYFYSLSDDPSGLWYQFKIFEEVPFVISNSNIAFKVIIKTENEFVSPTIHKELVVDFKTLTDFHTLNLQSPNSTMQNILLYKLKDYYWKSLDMSDTIYFQTVDIGIQNIEKRVNKYERTQSTIFKLDGKKIHQNLNREELTSDFAKVYRVIIEYINPLDDFKEYFPSNSKNYGIPVLLINTETGKHIRYYNDTDLYDEFINGFNVGSNVLGKGGSWIVDIEGSENTGVLSQNNGGTITTPVSNIFGRKLTIKKLPNGRYQQVYEFVGSRNTHFDEIGIQLLLPIYNNTINDITTSTYCVIKNFNFSCDVLTSIDPNSDIII